jgi:hypothetical protein
MSFSVSSNVFDGDAIPEPTTFAEMVDVSAA